MTTKQKIAIGVLSGIVGTYAIIFIYQRIQRKKADESVVSEDEAYQILDELKVNSGYVEPDWNEEDIIPVTESGLTDLQQFEVESGMGDY
jgi:hypothetical protein